MDNFEEILSSHEHIAISKQDQLDFNTLVPIVFNIANSLNGGATQGASNNDLEKVTKFFQGRTDYEIEEMAKNYIELHSNDQLGQTLNLPQLIELIHRYGKTVEEPLDETKHDDRVIQDAKDMHIIESGTSADILKRFDDTRR